MGTLIWIMQEPAPFTLSDIELRSLDGYPLNSPKEVFVLHLNTFNCQSCKRDTQILMRYHLQHPKIPIIDANIINDESQIEAIQRWKKTLDIQYTVAIVHNRSLQIDRLPTTLIIDPKQSTTKEVFGTLTYEKLLEITEKDR